MSITLEQIDLLRKRANVSYSDAKEALEKSNNNIVEALVYLEKQEKVKSKEECKGKIFKIAKDIIKKGNNTRFIIEKGNETVIDLSLTVTVVVGIVATPVLVIGIPLALLTRHKIKIKKEDGADIEVNKIINNITSSTEPEKKSDIDLNK